MSKIWERADFWPAERIADHAPDDFARGMAEGRRTVESELAAERQLLLQLATSLEMLQPPSSTTIAILIVGSVERLVRDIAGRAPVDADMLQDRANALAAIIAGESEAVLALHPDDVPLLDAAMRIISDPSLARGTVQVRTSSATYEDGVVPALDRLHAEIARLGILQ